MPASRRRLLLMSFFAAVAASLFRSGSAPAQIPKPPPPPRSSRSPSDPSDDSENSPNPPAGGAKALLEQRQKDIKKQIQKLYDLASQLKAEIEKTDSTTVLSLAMVKKAEEIEKLAKHIKENAKG